MKRAACALALALLAWACGDDTGPLAPTEPGDLRVRFEIGSAPPSLAEAIVVDSASWFPAVQLPTGTIDDVEVEGPFHIVFRNRSSQAVQMRYDLRFLDEDGFLIDQFIPFGQPVVFAPGQVRVEEGTFVVRTVPAIGRFGLAVMHIAARLTAP